MFDFGKCMTVNGTVRALEWTFPHVWLWVDVRDGTGSTQAWGFENGSPASLTKKGWSRTVLKAGDKVSVQFFPLKDGQQGGNISTVNGPVGDTLLGVPFPCHAQTPKP